MWWTRPAQHPTVQIARGITYVCIEYHEAEIEGLAHIVTVALNEPGIRLYLTPLDRDAVNAGWEYRTCWPPEVVAREKLAVAINGTLFATNRTNWEVWPGGWARSGETVVADHCVNHLDPNSYLLWFDDRLRPKLEKQKPPPSDVGVRAKWGIGGQGVTIDQGSVSLFAGHQRDSRTIVGINSIKQQLIIGTFDCASGHRAAEILAEQGATDAILIDGGSSTCLTFGRAPPGMARRTAVFPNRAIATVFGVGVD
jgi:hypothetical protein